MQLSSMQWERLHAVAAACGRVLPRRYRPDCCIAAARVVLEVLRREHVPCRAVSVLAAVWNPYLTGLLADLDDVAALTALSGPAEQVTAWARAGGRFIVLGADHAERPGYWNGHLAVLAYDQVLLDVTLPQANRPDKDIHLPPLVIEVTPPFAAGTHAVRGLVNGCRVSYVPRFDDQSFQRAPDWWDVDRHAETIRLVRRRLRQALCR